MNLIDIIILGIVLIIVGWLVYYNFILNKPSSCGSCSHKKSCESGPKGLQDFYKSVKD